MLSTTARRLAFTSKSSVIQLPQRVAAPATRFPLLPRIHASFYHAPPQPRSFSQRILYRKDGSPRSKLKGAIYVTAITSTLLILSEMVEVIDELNNTCFALEFLYQAKLVDRKYGDADLTDFDHAATYFFELFKPFMVVEGGSLDDAFKALLSDDTLREGLNDTILRTTQRIHAVLKADEEESQSSVMDVAWEVHDIWLASLEKMSQSATDMAVNKSFPSLTRSERRERRMDKEKSKDFEVLE